MKRFAQSMVTTVLLVTLSSPVVANPPRPTQPPAYHHYRGGGHGDWLGALLFIGLTAAIVNAVSQSPVPAPPTRAVPVPLEPIPVQPPTQYMEKSTATGMWYYFCRSGNMYYPYVRSCPEAWELVPTTPPQ